ncbi:MAG: hypothetical protein HY914_21990 [Desulfomonile tiedjei]|nr:hypothetical protein [Desulfomonile tiedjei]
MVGRLRCLTGAVTFGIFASLLASPASAWEFELGGAFSWSYEWYDQQGAKGFFGPYDSDSGSLTRAANLNFWNGGRFDRNLTTSADAGWSYFTVDFLPKITINEAVRFSGKYHLGSYGDPTASDYHTQDAPGINRAFSEGQWTMFWITVEIPWGVVGVGKRPWTFGNALQYDGEDAATTESLALVVPYGPFSVGIAFYPYRFAGNSSIPAFAGDDPYDLPGYPTAGGSVLRGQYFSRADRSGTFSKDLLGFMVYGNGPLEAGILGSYGAYHIGPEALLIDPLDPPLARLVPQSSELSHGTAFVRYDNGRFFFNAEAAWLYWTDRYHADSTGAVGPPNTRYIEQWRYMMEFGICAGPARLSLLGAWTPGPDRRNGQLIGKQTAAFVRHGNFDWQLGNCDVFRPYSYIFAFNYGSGLQAYNLNGDGYVRDALVLAVRMDYAVAANLNLFGTLFSANRTSHGYSWGCIGPNAGVPGGFTATPDGNVNLNLNRYPASPNIPDVALGYEIDAGFDWKLLEGWTVGAVVGYWQPGRWFSYACIDRSVSAWENGAAGNFFGTRPGRTIDPVLGGQCYLAVSF